MFGAAAPVVVVGSGGGGVVCGGGGGCGSDGGANLTVAPFCLSSCIFSRIRQVCCQPAPGVTDTTFEPPPLMHLPTPRLAIAMEEWRPREMGSPGYMPPEVMAGSVMTHESQDTFAMGVMLFRVCMVHEKGMARNLFTMQVRDRAREAERETAMERKYHGSDVARVKRVLLEPLTLAK